MLKYIFIFVTILFVIGCSSSRTLDKNVDCLTQELFDNDSTALMDKVFNSNETKYLWFVLSNPNDLVVMVLDAVKHFEFKYNPDKIIFVKQLTIENKKCVLYLVVFERLP